MTENKRIYGKMATSNEGNPTSLRIAIVGAGIGGLTAAVGLRRQGHHVDVSPSSESLLKTLLKPPQAIRAVSFCN